MSRPVEDFSPDDALRFITSEGLPVGPKLSQEQFHIARQTFRARKTAKVIRDVLNKNWRVQVAPNFPQWEN